MYKGTLSKPLLYTFEYNKEKKMFYAYSKYFKFLSFGLIFWHSKTEKTNVAMRLTESYSKTE